jgi:hypothetical protein
MLGKRVLLGVIQDKPTTDLLVKLFKKERRWLTVDVQELPAKDNPKDVVYELYATTPTDWTGGKHKETLTFFHGAVTALDMFMSELGTMAR